MLCFNVDVIIRVYPLVSRKESDPGALSCWASTSTRMCSPVKSQLPVSDFGGDFWCSLAARLRWSWRSRRVLARAILKLCRREPSQKLLCFGHQMCILWHTFVKAFLCCFLQTLVARFRSSNFGISARKQLFTKAGRAGSVRFVSVPDFSKINRFDSVRFGSESYVCRFDAVRPALFGRVVVRSGSVRLLIPSCQLRAQISAKAAKYIKRIIP